MQTILSIMGDSFTNFLLMLLIGLIAWLGKAAYDKMNEIYSLVRTLLISQKGNETITEILKKNQEDHEKRIRVLEEKD